MILSEQEIFKKVSTGEMTKLEALEHLKALNSQTVDGQSEKEEENQISKPHEEGPNAHMDNENIQNEIATIVSQILHIPQDELNYELSFKDFGVDSISGVEIVRDVNKRYNLNMDAVVLYDYATIPELADEVMKLIEVGTVIGDGNEEVQTDVYHDPYYLKLRQQYLQQDHSNREPEPNTVNIELNNKQEQGKDDKIHQNTLKPLTLKKREEIDSQKETEQNQKKKTYDRPEQIITLDMNNAKGDHNSVLEEKCQGIAIVGMSGRFPNAHHVKEYWKNLRDGVDCIQEIPVERWDINKYYNPDPKAFGKTSSRWMGVIPDADKFDPLFFNISPIEAETMDPQQRIFLEEAWKALEDAGYTDRELSNYKCGVFVGTAQSDYQQIVNRAKITNITDTFTGLSPSILPARVSYFLNLIGPSMAIDTACSSSLVAIHQACQSILAGDCEMALAGGVRLMLTPDLHIQSSNMGIMSSTGRCKPFSQDADGIAMGEGVGVIVLKKLSQAKMDGDNIYGVITSSGVNQDGRTNGITAPSARSQSSLEEEVYRRGGINPEDITLVETHGTGTRLGDPIEIKALNKTYCQFTKRKNYCAIGSVKANIGHTTMAAGVASVIKVLLAMKHKEIPPLIHFQGINDHIDIENSPFYINAQPIKWKHDPNKPRMATISSFGFSGTNCHMVIEESR